MKNSRFNFMLNPFVVREFKVLCARQSKSMSSLINAWIIDYIEANGINLEGVIDNVD